MYSCKNSHPKVTEKRKWGIIFGIFENDPCKYIVKINILKKTLCQGLAGQFPPEIEERRKKLYPIMRLAKRDGKRVRLVKDLLYVNGELYDPEKDVSTQPERMPYSRVVNTGSRQPQKRPRHGSTPDRVR